jgi:hypothetical protein
MVTMGGDLQPGSLADRLLTGLGQPQINPQKGIEKVYCSTAEKEHHIMTSWLLTCFSKNGWAGEKSSKKGENRKEKCFLSSQTRWSWQIKRARTSF